MSTEVSAEGPADFTDFNGHARGNRAAFLASTAPEAYTAIQQRCDGTMTYTAGTQLEAQIGQMFKMEGNDAVPTGEAPATQQTAQLEMTNIPTNG